LIIALLVASCTNLPANTPTDIPAATPTLPAVSNEWTVKMTHSGGIMGLMRSVEISSDGNYTVTDDRTRKDIKGKLSESELETLSGVVTNAKLTNSDKPGISVCADCFIYELEILSNGKISTIQLDDITLPGSGMEALVNSLRELMDSALK
jgi:hypothetical protein